MASFTIVGPITVPVIAGRAGGRAVDKGRLGDFWEEADCAADIGCYVFGIRSGRGCLPQYAGRTVGSFQNECFTADKLTKYHYALMDVAQGTPLMYFVVLDRTRGRPNVSAIVGLEERLIGLGMQRNPLIANVSGTREDEIIVRGVLGAGRGRPTAAASAFKAMMGLA